jgi:hypothetical protein
MFERYAIYVTPVNDLARRGAAWLGWDVALGASVPHPKIAGLDVAALTKTPRKYGFHGTIKPPFFLDEGVDCAGLSQALMQFCTGRAPVVLEGLQVSRLGRFLALTPRGPQLALAELAGAAVMQLDHFRAPPSEQELARRRARPLTPAQDKNLRDWGYPHVLDEFQFHMTLTGRLDAPDDLMPAVAMHFAPCLQQTFVVDSLTLVGQREDGMFQEIQRCTLTG